MQMTSKSIWKQVTFIKPIALVRVYSSFIHCVLFVVKMLWLYKNIWKIPSLNRNMRRLITIYLYIMRMRWPALACIVVSQKAMLYKSYKIMKNVNTNRDYNTYTHSIETHTWVVLVCYEWHGVTLHSVVIFKLTLVLFSNAHIHTHAERERERNVIRLWRPLHDLF